MRRVIGYAISENNKFENLAYNGVGVYYLAKKIGVFDSMTGELNSEYYEPLSEKYAYRDELITTFRGKEVVKI